MNEPLKKIQFFGYWGGSLPHVTNLHFLSFLHFHPESQYDLWLDQDVGQSIPSRLSWIENHPQIHIKVFSLSQLVNQYVTPLNKKGASKFFDVLRFIHRKKIIRYIDIKSYYDPLFKLTYKHSSPLFQYHNDLVYRGDLARCLIPFAHYESPSVYSDLDVCFLSDLNHICQDRGFVYQWENYGFANSAILYTPDQEIAKKILAAGNRIECFRPWYLFTNAICQELGLKIYPTKQFDAMWNKESLLFRDAMLFFKNSSKSQAITDELLSGSYIVNHWHNNWKTIPEEGSPNKLLEKKFALD